MFARRDLYERKIAIHRKVIEQQDAEIEAATAQSTATRRQLEITQVELAAISGLVTKGYARRTQLSELQARESELIGRAADMTGRRAKAEQARAGAELEILSLGNDMQQQVATTTSRPRSSSSPMWPSA